MAVDYNAPVPIPTLPMVDPTSGVVTDPWFRFFTALVMRTGGLSGLFGPAVTVTLGASPFVYTAPSHGAVMLSGGGVVRLELASVAAGVTTWLPAGSYYAALPLTGGAKVRLTYVGAPSMIFIPG